MMASRKSQKSPRAAKAPLTNHAEVINEGNAKKLYLSPVPKKSLICSKNLADLILKSGRNCYTQPSHNACLFLNYNEH